MKALHMIILGISLALFQRSLWAALPRGQVVGWGHNISGQATGVPSRETSFATGRVTIAGQLLDNAVAIAAGRSHGLAIRDNGAVAGWGGNSSAEAVGFETEYPYRTNGYVRIAGQVLSNVVSISAGCNFSLAVKGDGTVVAWGNGPGERIGSQAKVPVGLSNVVAVAAGFDYSMALKKDGTVLGWGARNVPHGLSNIVAIAAGREAYAPGLALKENGEVIEWTTSEESIPFTLRNIVAIAAGSNHGLALKSDGTVFGWGGNRFGQATGVPATSYPNSAHGAVVIDGLPLTNVIAIAAGHEFSLALKRDGKVVAWGCNDFHTTDVPPGLSDVVAIAAGDDFCLAITTNRVVAEGFQQ
ncbi:MAG TPA: hypothetical protein VFV96_14585 [Verrucomicrobiae bacterium]|nr:hypothetical protein [Verrucomicrobiae bacterium]